MEVIPSEATEQTVAETEPAASGQEPELAAHPGPRQYVMVAIVLAIATGFEVGLYYMNIPRGLFVGLLLFFAATKFSLVVLWFMHLRFDSRILGRMFATGLLLAISVYMIVLVTFGVIEGVFLLILAAALLLGLLGFVIARARAAVRIARPAQTTPATPAPGHGS